MASGKVTDHRSQNYYRISLVSISEMLKITLRCQTPIRVPPDVQMRVCPQCRLEGPPPPPRSIAQRARGNREWEGGEGKAVTCRKGPPVAMGESRTLANCQTHIWELSTHSSRDPGHPR